MKTNYEYLISDREALVDILEASEWIRQIEGEYCMKICPNRNGNICLCGGGDDCNAPHTLKEQISLWLDIEA